MIRWLWGNKEWIFSGVGVVFIFEIVRCIFKRFGAKGSNQRQYAKAGKTVMQAQRDININVEPHRGMPSLRVLVHRAHFISNSAEHYYFIKITNTTPRTDIEITHVWYQNGLRLEVLNRPLPKRLRENETWETYVTVQRIPNDPEVYKHFHVLISTGEIFSSEQNVNVPPVGYVAG